MQQLKRGQIWIVKMGEGTGSEQKHDRPIIVFQNDVGNKYSPTVTIIPLTGNQFKKWMPTHVTLYKTTCLISTSIALTEQITTISKERFVNYIGMVNESEMFEIEDALMLQVGITKENKNKIAYA